ncbi:MAG TPA: dNTP triphosphohydrolase [Oscillatoriaceae cyanobacterium]
MSRYTSEDLARRDATDTADPQDPRSPFEVDRARIIHSSAFRRLQGKTQIFGVGEGDFFRTRLTHSMETAQIGKGLVLFVNKTPELAGAPISVELVEAACLAHDLGHPPFGHNGEAALQAMMHAYGGFEANAQNLRILTRLESKREEFGLNLTRATLRAVLKYLEPYSARKRARTGPKAHLAVEKCYYDQDEPLMAWIRADGDRAGRSLESEIMEWADDIAYSVHDLEDGLHSGLIIPEHFNNLRLVERMAEYAGKRGAIGCDVAEVQAFMARVFAQLPGGSALRLKEQRKRLTSTLIHAAIINTGVTRGESGALSLAMDEGVRRQVAMLKAVEFVLMIRNPRVTTLEYKGRLIVTQLFRALAQDDSGDLLPEDVRESWDEVRHDEPQRLRVVCDYIAGLTDLAALKMYARLFEPGVGSMQDEL